jgi:hypothetical protein
VTDVPRRTWARAKGAGAHRLRRGAWYLVVNDTQPNVVIVNVLEDNVPVPRSMLDIRLERPRKWSLVEWQESQRGARRASEENMGFKYLVCPACSVRANLTLDGDGEVTCAHCSGRFPVDWERPC